MITTSSNMPCGFAGLQYTITQVCWPCTTSKERPSAIGALGSSGWDVFDYKPPAHHDTELRGECVDHTLKGAELMVGSLNLEQLEPANRPSLWKEVIDERCEGSA